MSNLGHYYFSKRMYPGRQMIKIIIGGKQEIFIAIDNEFTQFHGEKIREKIAEVWAETESNNVDEEAKIIEAIRRFNKNSVVKARIVEVPYSYTIEV